MNESSHSQGTPAYLGSLIPPLFPPLSLSEMTRALRAKVRSSGRGDWRCVLASCLSMDAQQFRFPSLAPRVERGLPRSLPRPFCLSPGFSFPVDPYRTGEFLLAVSVTPRQSLAAVLHTLCQDSFSPRECFVLTRFYGLAISQYMRTSLAAITSPWQGLGAHEHTSPTRLPCSIRERTLPNISLRCAGVTLAVPG